MIKLFKWDVIDFLKRRWLILGGMALALLLILLPSSGTGLVNAFLVVCSALIGFVAFLASLVSAALLPFRWLMRDSNLLERSLPFAPWKLLLSKLVLSGLLNLLACLFFIQLSLFHGRFASGQLTLLSGENFGGVGLLLVMLVLADATLMFVYIISKSFTLFKKASMLIAALAGLILIAGFLFLTVPVMVKAGALSVPSFSFQNIFTMNGSLQIYDPTLPLVFGLVLIMLEIIISSELLKRRFQKD